MAHLEENMKRHKLLLEIIVFFIVLILVIGKYYDAVRYKNLGNGGGMENFYNIDVPVDAIVYGSSHAACTVNNGLLWENYGIASYTLSAGNQTVDGIYYFMRETFKVNKPKIALVETYTLGLDSFELKPLYRTVLTTKWSLYYPFYILKHAHDLNYSREFTEELLLRMPIVHSRYNELDRADFINENFYNRGYQGSNENTPISRPVYTDDRAEIPAICQYYLDEMVKLCKKNGVQLVFFNAPYEASEEDVAMQNSILDFANANDIPYIGFIHNDDEYGINYDTDFREFSHLNDTGANKVTTVLGEYMEENYDMTDRRDYAGYDDWNTHVDFLYDKQDKYRLYEQNTLPDYLNYLSSLKDKYTLIISLNGDYNALGEEAYSSNLLAFGIDEQSYLKGGTWLIQNGEITYYTEGESSYQFNTEFQNNADCNLYKTDEDEFGHVLINGYDCTRETNGISIQIFDEHCLYFVDDIYVNVYDGLDVNHIDY